MSALTTGHFMQINAPMSYVSELFEDNPVVAQCWGRVTQRMRHDIGDAGVA
jgi:hypothetical protein